MTRSFLARWLRALLLPLLLATTLGAPARAQDAFSNEQLDQMLAPIALYPDSLLSQVLMACTYPSDVDEAVKWSKANPKQTGDAAVKAVEAKDWDPSVASLVAFPQALAMMGERPDWVQNVGDAFLAQPEAVMDSVQRLRAAAQKAGNLKTTQQQTVIVEAPAPQQTIIKIEPAQPQVVYVPAYNPTVVYGAWPYPSYPPYYWPTPGYVFGNALMAGIAFGTGVAITNAIWGGFDWGRRDININVNRYNNINVNKRLSVNQTNIKWNHNADHRRGVPYRDAKSREQYGKQLAGADARKQFRGKDDASRERAQAALRDRGVDPAAAREKLRSDPATRERAQAAARNIDSDKARAAMQNVDRDRARAAAQNVDRDKVRTAAQNIDRDKARAAAQNVDRDRARAAAQNVDRDRARAAAQNVDRDRARAAAQNVDRDRARQAAQSRNRDNALRGAGNGVQARQQINRGAASRQAMQQRPAASPGGARAAPRAGGGRAPVRAR